MSESLYPPLLYSDIDPHDYVWSIHYTATDEIGTYTLLKGVAENKKAEYTREWQITTLGLREAEKDAWKAAHDKRAGIDPSVIINPILFG